MLALPDQRPDEGRKKKVLRQFCVDFFPTAVNQKGPVRSDQSQKAAPLQAAKAKYLKEQKC